MSRHDRSVRTGSDRTNLYDEITTKIIAELEDVVASVDPWALREDILQLDRLIRQAKQLEAR